jgi:hypothetical protein
MSVYILSDGDAGGKNTWNITGVHRKYICTNVNIKWPVKLNGIGICIFLESPMVTIKLILIWFPIFKP